MMALCFGKFEFLKKTSLNHYIYRIISNNPYDTKSDYNGNSVRYKIISCKENNNNGYKMFIYVIDNQYLLNG